MSAEVLEGLVAFENLTEHEMYNGQSTGKFSVVLSLEEPQAVDLEARGVKLREYEGVKQRKFASKFEVGIVNADGTPFQGRVPRGSKVRILWQRH